jgi:NhaA family Na+:H+ antiporter
MSAQSPERRAALRAAAPPGSWWFAHHLARRAAAPVEKFLAIEAASGILLLLTAAIALLWANSPWKDEYRALFHTVFGLRLGQFAFERDLHFWINDGVMTVFYFVVGLEIRRELYRGQLSDVRRATLPLVAALGGMVVPAIIYALINKGHASFRGWGVPMATDIAFAVGVLTLLGKRVPPALRILLLALAVIDDVGAIVVIAIFYSSTLNASGFLLLAVGLGLVFALRAMGVRHAWLYVPAGVVAWAGAYTAGIHPTLAGVAIGFMTPVRPWPADDEETEPRSPAEHLEHSLHGWVAYGAMPLFAFANAGVSLGTTSFSGDSLLAFLGVGFGLVVGKPVGVFGASWLATRLRIAALPAGTTWMQVALVGVVAGIGFTMSMFIAELAFPRGATLETGKAGILIASTIAAVFAYAFGRAILPSELPAACARTESEAEAEAGTTPEAST